MVFTEHSLWVRLGCKRITAVNWVTGKVVVLGLFYKYGSQDTERLGNLLKVII